MASFHEGRARLLWPGRDASGEEERSARPERGALEERGRLLRVQEVLEDKERLYWLQQELLEKRPVLVQVGLSLPGGYLRYEWQRLFADAVEMTKAGLSSVGAIIREEIRVHTCFGPLCLLALDETDARVVKRSMVTVEESSPKGRLWDLDVIVAEGVVDRGMLGMAPRRCLVCSEDAHTCRKRGAHKPDEVISAARRLLDV